MGPEDAQTSGRSPHARGRASEALLHPAMLASIALLVLNDHWLKWRWPGWVTGKLSDVAGLAFFPLLLAALVERACPARWRGRRLVGACAALTVMVFAAVKCWPAATEGYRVGLGALQWLVGLPLRLLAGHGAGSPPRVMAVTDPSDLLALPAVLLAVLVAEPRRGAPS